MLKPPFGAGFVVQGTLPVQNKSLTSNSRAKGPNPSFIKPSSSTLDQTLCRQSRSSVGHYLLFCQMLDITRSQEKLAFQLSWAFESRLSNFDLITELFSLSRCLRHCIVTGKYICRHSGTVICRSAKQKDDYISF